MPSVNRDRCTDGSEDPVMNMVRIRVSLLLTLFVIDTCIEMVRCLQTVTAPTLNSLA